MEEWIASLGSGTSFVMSIVLFLWSVLLFLTPFFVFAAARRAKQVSQKMDRLIELQERAEQRVVGAPSRE